MLLSQAGTAGTRTVTSHPTDAGAASTSTSKGAAASVVTAAVHVNSWFPKASFVAAAVPGFLMVIL